MSDGDLLAAVDRIRRQALREGWRVASDVHWLADRLVEALDEAAHWRREYWDEVEDRPAVSVETTR